MSILEEKLTTISTDAEILERDELYCSHGDTVHYDKVPKVFADCNELNI